MGSNGCESQTASFAEGALWLSRLAWAEMHGIPMIRHQLHDTVRCIHGALVTDSRGIFDASTKSESPQKGLRSAKSGVELEQACDDALRSNAVLRWNHGGAMLADVLTKVATTARRTFELFLQNQQRWRLVYDPKFQSERRRTKKDLQRLVEDIAQDGAVDVEVEEIEGAHFIFVVGEQGRIAKIGLALEDGWIKVPDSPEIAKFNEGCRTRIRQENEASNELGDNTVLGDGFCESAHELIDQKHIIGAWDMQPVPLQAHQHQESFKNPEENITGATSKA